MRRSSNRVTNAAGIAIALVLVLACGGGEEEIPAGTPGTPAAGPATTPGAAAPTTPTASAAQDSAPSTVLEREVFRYSAASRDPFESLLRTGDVKPLLEDLRLTSVTYDNQFPMNSVAVISDTTEAQRYTVRVGDRMGRLRVSSIRLREVVLAYEEFGRELLDTLRLSRNQGGSQ